MGSQVLVRPRAARAGAHLFERLPVGAITIGSYQASVMS